MLDVLFDAESIILCMNLKIALRVIAGRAYLGSFGSHYDMSAVAAFPDFNLAFFKNLCGLHVLKQGTVTLLMGLFNGFFNC